MRVLVVEDHPKLALTVATGLRHAGMAGGRRLRRTNALDQVAEADYDVVVLDRDLPGVSGDEVCRRLVRHGSTTRVLMLTAAGDLEDRVQGLALGADDYLPKPFEFPELVAPSGPCPAARVSPYHPCCPAMTSNSTPPAAPPPGPGGTSASTRRSSLCWRSSSPPTAPWSPANSCSRGHRDQNADPFSQAVKTTMSRLRAKLGDPPVIETVAKSGYRIS